MKRNLRRFASFYSIYFDTLNSSDVFNSFNSFNFSRTFVSCCLFFFLVFFLFIHSLSYGQENLRELQNPQSSYYYQKYPSGSFSSYIKGRRLFNRKRYGPAISHFKKFVAQKSPILDYGLYHLGVSYFHIRYYKSARKALQKLRKSYRESKFLVPAFEKEAMSYVKKKQYSQIIFLSQEEETGILKAWSFYYRAFAEKKLNRRKDSLQSHLNFLEEYLKLRKENLLTPSSKQLKRALYRVEELRKNLQKDSMTIQDRLNLAKTHYLMGDYKNSLKNLSKIPKDRKWKYSYLLYHSLNLIKLGKTKTAKTYLQKALQEISLMTKDTNENSNNEKNNEINKERNKEIIKAVLLYTQTIEKDYPKIAFQHYKKLSHRFDSILVLPAVKKFLKYSKQQENKKDIVSALEKLAQLNQGKILWSFFLKGLNRGENSSEVDFLIEYFPKILKKLSDKKRKSQMLYWLAFLSLKKGDLTKAKEFFSESYLSYRYDYYSYKSFFSLKNYSTELAVDISEIKKENQKRQKLFFERKDAMLRYLNSYQALFSNESHLNLLRALYLYQKGFRKNAKQELLRFFSQTPESGRFYRGLAYFFRRIGRHQESIYYTKQAVQYINGEDGSNYIPPDLVEFLYPRFYKEIVQKNSLKFQVDPYLVLSVIREESRFNPKARSWAGARGLMQIMPRTGRYLAKLLKIRKYSLYNIRSNIAMGSFYLSRLIQQFGSYSYALASYNGGPGRMATRIQKALDEPKILSGEHLIENIKIKETRNYIKTVFQSYNSYLELYNQLDSFKN